MNYTARCLFNNALRRCRLGRFLPAVPLANQWLVSQQVAFRLTPNEACSSLNLAGDKNSNKFDEFLFSNFYASSC